MVWLSYSDPQMSQIQHAASDPQGQHPYVNDFWAQSRPSPRGHIHFTRVTSPKGAKTRIFIFFRRFWAPRPCPRPSPGLEVQFPVKNAGFGCVCVELCHFSSFSKVLESCEPLFADLGFLFFDFETWEGFSVWIGKRSLSWIWIGRVSFVEKLNF